MTARLDLIAHGATASTRAAWFPADEALEASAASNLEALRGRLRPYGRVLTAPPAPRARPPPRWVSMPTSRRRSRGGDYGRWRGLPLKDVAAREPEGFAAWLGDPAAAPHGGDR